MPPMDINNVDSDSSDLDDEETPTSNPWANAGKASISSMIDNVPELRAHSKRATKQLQLSPSERQLRLGCCILGDGTTPSGIEIERFKRSIAGTTQGQGEGTPGFSWLLRGVGRVLDDCRFKYSDFSLTDHDKLRIKATFQDLLSKGATSNDLKREDSGRAASPAGNITRGYFEIKTLARLLAYKDITIKFDGAAETFDDLIMIVQIVNEKGTKHDGGVSRQVLLKSQRMPNNLHVCPIKAVLIMALRTSNVDEPDIDELLRVTRSRPNKAVKWTHPERPVLPQFLVNGAGVNVDAPAGHTQLTAFLRTECLALGVQTRIRAHDLRRRSAREIGHFDIKGTATDAVASCMGHADRGRSRRYVGGVSVDVRGERLENPLHDPLRRIDLPTEVQASRYKHVRASKQDITAACVAQGVDDKDPKARARVAQEIRKWKQADNVEGLRRQLHVPQATGCATASRESLSHVLISFSVEYSALHPRH
ncbi:hypothetical protein M011DRAFT_490750 [Sporormia fimetaria CBS 119925]|uniref:Uncharacterized protein n=1 Tax=Sporormia fimetaria CBS 119925 TaxID=1340428 RepID=A0A6A6UXR1_9PLEO|nr:hypothetical protein M011DRAFT_490750 [Sporormia fimetaria CBS 119925]